MLCPWLWGWDLPNPTVPWRITDTFHKPGFKLHARIMHHLFEIVQTTEVIQAPLWDVNAMGPAAFPDNATFVRERLINLLSTSFPNLTPAQVQSCVIGMFDLKVRAPSPLAGLWWGVWDCEPLLSLGCPFPGALDIQEPPP